MSAVSRVVDSNKRMIKSYLRHEGGVIVLKDKGRTVDAEWVRARLAEVVTQLELNNAVLEQLAGGSDG